MGQFYLVVSASTPAGLSTLVSQSLGGGYRTEGGVQLSGSWYFQTLITEPTQRENYLINPERLSKNFRANTTGSSWFQPSASYK